MARISGVDLPRENRVKVNLEEKQLLTLKDLLKLVVTEEFATVKVFP